MPRDLSDENGSGLRPAGRCLVDERRAAAFPYLTEGESVSNLQHGVGVDRLSISFPVRRHAPPHCWDDVDRRNDQEGRTIYSTQVWARGEVGGVGLFVGVTTVQGKLWGKVECNPSRLHDPGGCSLLPPAQLPGAFATMWAAGKEQLEPDCLVFDARLKRVDVARDFRDVTSPALYVEGLGPLKRPFARRSFTYNDPARADAQTLFVGSGAGGVRLYDQRAAYPDKGVPDGSLRFEVEARPAWLEKVGAVRVSDLDAVACDRLAAERWEWSRMGTVVSGPVNAVQVAQRAVRTGEVSQPVADRVLGGMLRRSFGYGSGDRVTEWRHRELMERLGLTAAALWSNDLDRQAVGRLDFASGTEELSLSGSS